MPNLTNVEVPDSGGLICGFALRPDIPPEPIAWDGRVPPSVLQDGPVWLHFNLADTRAQRWIGGAEEIPATARELLLDSDTHIRCERAGQGLAGVLGDLRHDFDNDPEGMGVLRIYVDERHVITGRGHPLKAMDRLRWELRNGLQVDSPLDLFGHLVEDLADTFDSVVKVLKEDIDEAEDRILAGRIHDQGIELGRVRRLLARLRRHAGADRNALLPLLGMSGWCGNGDRTRLRQAVERLDGVVQDLELVQERSRLLQEEIAGRLGEATNRNLYILSIVTTVLLPINLITGIFGMNTGGLPWHDDPGGFWWVIVWMIVAVITALSILHWRKVL